MTPRPYQLDCIAKTLTAFESHNRVLDVLPTGSGKTIIFSWLADHFNKQNRRVLILAHREELINQAIEKLHKATGIYAQKEKAESRASRHAQVIVGSIQTLRDDRLRGWPANHFGLVVADEAHHSTSASWRDTLGHFAASKILGVTATPHRSDEKNLGNFYETVGYEIGLFDLIHQGYLSPIVLRSIPLKIDVGSVQMRSGDYAVDSLGKTLEPYLPLIAGAIREHAGFRRILIFCPLIATSEKMAAAMKAEGFSCEHVHGESHDRREILARFENGETECLCNAMLLTEGYDNPAVDCVINLRLTKSNTLYSQIVGRGTRIHPGKENLLLMDFLWQHGRHKLCKPAHLIAGDDDELAEEMTAQLENPKRYGEPQLNLEDLMSETQAKREAALARRLAEKANRKAREERLIQSATEVADTQIFNPEKPISQKQMRLIIRFGLDPTGMTMKQAGQIIGERFAKQRKAA
jgi:superfamily II DNA or RNA helicase